MKYPILVAILALGTAACAPTNNATMGGALAGATVGAVVADSDDRLDGALIGAGVGAVAGTLIGQANKPNECVYEDRYGRRYVAAC